MSRCYTDLTALLEAEKTPHAYERASEVEEVLRLLASPLARHPVLLGYPGIGKSAVAREVARRVRHGECPTALEGLRVLATSPRQLLSNLPPGDGWRAALPQLWEEWRNGGRFMLLFEDAHDAAGAGRRSYDEMDLAALLTGFLTESSEQAYVLAEARADRWEYLLSNMVSYTGLFVPVPLPELEGERLATVLDQATRDLENRHSVLVTPAARQRAVELTRRYIIGEAMPGKALALLEETMAAQRAEPSSLPSVGPQEVTARFALRTGLPLLLLDEEQLWDEEAVRAHFQQRVLGQELAVEAVLQRLGLLKAGIHDPHRPLGVLLFMGPTGVGKTDLAKTLANFLFGEDERLVRLNMSDYSEHWQFRDLFGAPDSSEPIEVQRGQLSLRLGDYPFTVLLLDEFEKAFPNIFQRFLQLFDEGVLVNGAGEEINRRNSSIILTSNLAADMTRQDLIGFPSMQPSETVEQRALRTVEEFFTPEFVNRIDQVVYFHPLSRATIRRIAFRELDSLFRREGIQRRNVALEVDDSVVDWVVEHGYSAHFGARYLRRQIEKSISYPVARALIAQPVEPGSLLRLYVHGDRPGRVEAALIPPQEATSLAGTRVAEGPSGRQVTLEDVRDELPALRERVEQAMEIHQVEMLRTERDELLAAMARPDFWEGAANEQQLQRLGQLSARVERVDGLLRTLDEAEALLHEI